MAADGAPGRRAVFLDRDGTLIHDPGYLGDPAGVVLFPEVPDALAALCEAGFGRVVCTNQSGIARGRYGVEHYRHVADRLVDLLAARGVPLLATYFCPFHPEGVVPECAREHEDPAIRPRSRLSAVLRWQNRGRGRRVRDVGPEHPAGALRVRVHARGDRAGLRPRRREIRVDG